MITSNGNVAKVQEGRKIITYVVLGLAIIFIGKGFISLIYSILDLAGDGTNTEQSTGGEEGTLPNGNANPTGICDGTAFVVNNKVVGSCVQGYAYCINGFAYDRNGAKTDFPCSDTCKAGTCQNGLGVCTGNSQCKPTTSASSEQQRTHQVGGACSKDSNCSSGLKCDNGLCKRPTGNGVGEGCLTGQQCAQGLSCDSTSESTVVIDGREVGTCFQPLCISRGSDVNSPKYCINKPDQRCTSTVDCR